MLFNTTRWRRTGYTLWAPIYNLLAKPLASARRRSIDRLAPQSGENVLIVGAGTGLDLDDLPIGMHITAIDLTPAMLNKLRQRAARLGHPVEVRVMDAEQLDFPDASFDTAVLNLIVSVVADPVRCLREVARVLRPGGRAVVLDKFIPDGQPTPILRKMLNPLASFFGTQITRRLEPIVAASGLRIRSNESAGGRGYLRIALLTKD